MAEKPVGLRLDKIARERLEELSKIYQKPNNKIVSDLICADYDRIQGNPELKKMIDKLNQLQEAISEFNREKNG